MKATLYGPGENVVGTVTLPSERTFPAFLYLDEGPRGGKRLFGLADASRGVYREVNPAAIPVVKLDPLTEEDNP